MGIATQRGFARLLQRVDERPGGIERCTEHQRVHKETNQIFYLGLSAIGNRGTDRDLILPAIAREEDLKGSQQRHVESAEFSQEHPKGAAIASDMMERQKQYRSIIRLAQRSGTQQAITLEVEWSLRFFVHQALDGLGALSR